MDSEGSWTEWRRRVFGDPYLVWHDGPNFDAGGYAERRRTVVRRLSG